MNQEKALPRLDNEEIDIVWQSMSGGPAHWLKGFGYQNYAKAIEDELLLKIARHQVGAEARIVTYVPSRARKGVLQVTAYGPPDMELPPHREVLSDRLMYSIQSGIPAAPMRTDQEIVDQTDDLAREFAKLDGYELDGKFYNDTASRSRHYWALACTAQAHLTNTDPCDALSALEDEQASAAPASVKDHVIREVVNELRDIAQEHHNSGQLRVRLRAAIEPLIK
jgi:hypothetical protein